MLKNGAVFLVCTSLALASCVPHRSQMKTVGQPVAAQIYGSDVGLICGSRHMLGKNQPSFNSGACGISNPVEVYEIAGVSLSQPAKINCDAALALGQWVMNSAKPTARRIDKQLSELNIAASYACRSRNHRKGAKLSEHAFGNAVDISGFKFTDGTELTVSDAYHRYGTYFKTVQSQACGTFGTVLGPGVRLHDDHFHFDTASYSSGPYCK